MARQQADLRLGYYPCPPDAVKFVAYNLQAPEAGQFTILDPCAGEGRAVVLLASILNCPPEHVYAVELEEGRSATLKADEFLAAKNVVAPASFFGVTCKFGSMSLVWCNPPFADEQGGGTRIEAQFLDRATQLLATKGVLVLICPEDVAKRNELRMTLSAWYDHVRIIPFPPQLRKYNEVAVIGIKRAEAGSSWRQDYIGNPPGGKYRVPNNSGPGDRFFKSDLTDDEYVRYMTASPLMRHLQTKPRRKLARPPLPLGAGHIALLLASGELDGIVSPPDEPPHLVRGSVKKVAYESSRDREVQDDGSVTTKVVTSEKIVLCVRAVTHDGSVHTWTDQDQEKPELELADEGDADDAE